MYTDEQVGGLSREARHLVYAQMGMSNDAIRDVENMVLGSPGREVGKGALRNVMTRFDSIKNGKPRVVESHTCELVYAYELELDTDVVGYYAQVTCSGIERVLPNGRHHITSAHLDFLVFRQKRVELVECKPQEWLIRDSANPRSDWRQRDGRWCHEPYDKFAHSHQMQLSISCPPNEPGVYLQNLEAIYAMLRPGMEGFDERVFHRALNRIMDRPTSIYELCEDIDGFTTRAALQMLSRSMVYGPCRSTPVLLTDQFFLYADRQQAQLADEIAMRANSVVLTQSGLTDSLLQASVTDMGKARERMARLKAIAEGQAPQTRRMRQLARKAEGAAAAGEPPLSACITQYRNSGNRLPRLSSGQQQAMETVISEYWNKGRVRKPRQLYFVLKEECVKRGIAACGKTALYKRLRQENPARHALATGGLRAYQAIRPSTDPRKRSLPPIGYGHTLHVDSSDLDNRIAKNILKLMPAVKAKFYVGVDGATGEVMAHSLIFGSARTDGLAILMREYVRRHKCLPHLIHVDRGPENRSWWIEELAESHFSLRWSPTAGSAWNGIAENAIKQVNGQVAHQLIGSTEPDQKGRRVDGRFKSYKNAKSTFDTVNEQFLAYLYEDLPMTPSPSDGRSPIEKREDALESLGAFGIPCELNEGFLLRTSIKVDVKRSVDPKRGVRTEEGHFTSDELIRALRFHKVDELRSDCEDPSILRVWIGGTWLKAFHSRVQSIAMLSASQKLFDLMYASTRRAQVRERYESIAQKRNTRIELANFATLSTRPNTALEGAKEVRAIEGEPALPLPSNNTDLNPRRALWDQLDSCLEYEATASGH
jgi:putative transposase